MVTETYVDSFETSDQVKIVRAAAFDLSANRAVVIGDDALLTYADPSNVAHYTRSVWFTPGVIMRGQLADVLAYGAVTEPTWTWMPGKAILLGANGVLTQTTPTFPSSKFLLQLGTAETPTRIIFEPRFPIVLA